MPRQVSTGSGCSIPTDIITKRKDSGIRPVPPCGGRERQPRLPSLSWIVGFPPTNYSGYWYAQTPGGKPYRRLQEPSPGLSRWGSLISSQPLSCLCRREVEEKSGAVARLRFNPNAPAVL